MACRTASLKETGAVKVAPRHGVGHLIDFAGVLHRGTP